MKVLFYPVYMDTPHFETELELMDNHIKNGDDVYVIHCKGELKTCFYNPNHQKHFCITCQSRFSSGLKLLNSNKINLIRIPKTKNHFPEIPSQFKNIQELKSFKIGTAEIGFAAASSLISTFNREHNLDTVKYCKEVYREVSNSYHIYQFFSHTLLNLNPDKVYIFNGRLSTYFPALNACESLNIPYIIHERGGTINKYSLTKNTLPHDISYCEKEIEEYWQKEDEVLKEKLGNQFYLDSRKRVENSWYSFTKSQVYDKLPDNFDKSKKNIVFFNSTIEEYAAVRGWENPIPIYGNEINAFRTIFDSLKNNDEIHVYLRVHPNLKGFDNTQTKDINSLKGKYKNLTIIEPESSIDSYALLDKCDIIMTFFSTIGIEAAYWGKPVILLGQTYYQNLKSTYNPTSHNEVIELIKSKLIPKDKLGAIKYGYWALNRGIEFEKFRPTGIRSGYFLGKKIQPTKWALLKAGLLFIFSIKSIKELSFIFKSIKEYAK